VELRQLAYFVAVAEELHFGRAAERLHIVQPAVSQQVQRLERDLGVELFDRSRRTVRLTPAGERLLIEARATLAAAGQVRRVATDIVAGRDGILRLGTSQGLGARLEDLLERLVEVAPRLRVELVSLGSAERIAALHSGELDAALVRWGAAENDVQLQWLWDDPVVAALPVTHALGRRPAVHLAELRRLPLRLAPRAANPAFHDAIIAACRQAGFTPVSGAPFTTLPDTLAAIGTGAPSWTPLYAAAAEQLVLSRVVTRPIAGLAAPTYLATGTERPSPAARRLRAALWPSV
jgi:DNA-binding transcriptional LysR family regulator